MKDPHKSLANTIHRIIGQVLIQEVPQEEFGLVSIHHIVVTKEFDYVDIYIQSFTEDESIIDFLETKTRLCMQVMYKALARKRIPQIRWHYDNSAAMADKIEQIIRS